EDLTSGQAEGRWFARGSRRLRRDDVAVLVEDPGRVEDPAERVAGGAVLARLPEEPREPVVRVLELGLDPRRRLRVRTPVQIVLEILQVTLHRRKFHSGRPRSKKA